MNNNITPLSLRRDSNERWEHKPQYRDNRKTQIHRGIYKRNGEYWFHNKRIKDLVAYCRREGLIVAPPIQSPND